MFERGNKLGAGARPRLFEAALRRAIAQNNGEQVRDAAEALLKAAVKGEPWALQMLADRLDGKAAQAITVESQDVEGLTLAELSNRLAAALIGVNAPDISSVEPGGVH